MCVRPAVYEQTFSVFVNRRVKTSLHTKLKVAAD